MVCPVGEFYVVPTICKHHLLWVDFCCYMWCTGVPSLVWESFLCCPYNMHSCTYPPVGEFLCSSCNTRSCTYHKQSFPSPLSTQREQYLYKKTRNNIYFYAVPTMYTVAHITHNHFTPSLHKENSICAKIIYIYYILLNIYKAKKKMGVLACERGMLYVKKI